jgi:hypothetical protein
MAKRKRIIDQLREQFPNETWHYDHFGFPQWVTDSGWGVTGESVLTPRYDGDDETCAVQYRRSDTRELVLFGLGGLFA